MLTPVNTHTEEMPFVLLYGDIAFGKGVSIKRDAFIVRV